MRMPGQSKSPWYRSELREQRALRRPRHALGADERGTVGPELAGGDGEEVGVLADVDGATRHRQPRRGAEQPVQAGVGGLPGLAGETS
jgi:hypothetical protein